MGSNALNSGDPGTGLTTPESWDSVVDLFAELKKGAVIKSKWNWKANAYLVGKIEEGKSESLSPDESIASEECAEREGLCSSWKMLNKETNSKKQWQTT